MAAVTVARCAHVVVEPGARVTGAATGWQADDEITLFDSMGFALEDMAIASLAYARLVELGKTSHGLTFDKCRLIALLQYRTIAS